MAIWLIKAHPRANLPAMAVAFSMWTSQPIRCGHYFFENSSQGGIVMRRFQFWQLLKLVDAGELGVNFSHFGLREKVVNGSLQWAQEKDGRWGWHSRLILTNLSFSSCTKWFRSATPYTLLSEADQNCHHQGWGKLKAAASPEPPSPHPRLSETEETEKEVNPNKLILLSSIIIIFIKRRRWMRRSLQPTKAKLCLLKRSLLPLTTLLERNVDLDLLLKDKVDKVDKVDPLLPTLSRCRPREWAAGQGSKASQLHHRQRAPPHPPQRHLLLHQQLLLHILLHLLLHQQ